MGVGESQVDLSTLKDICAGKFSASAEEVSSPVEVDLCGFKSYNETDGEWYICGLEKHGPKVKHGEWMKV